MATGGTGTGTGTGAALTPAGKQRGLFNVAAPAGGAVPLSGVAVPTPVQNYALGRDCVLDLLFQAPSADPTTADFTVGMKLCISEGSIALDVDMLEIASNCQRGWKLKLPGLKSGTLNFTGFAAVSSIPTTPGDKLSLATYHGKFCQVAMYHNQVNHLDVPTGNSAFELVPKTVGKGANGFVRNLNITVSPDDVCKVTGTIEFTGDQDFMLYMAVQGFQG